MQAEDDDWLDPQDMTFVRSMAQIVRRSVVDDLLAGNDARCFTLDQYRERYQGCRFASELVPITEDLATMHLRSLPGVVFEVRPGVWAARDGVCLAGLPAGEGAR